MAGQRLELRAEIVVHGLRRLPPAEAAVADHIQHPTGSGVLERRIVHHDHRRSELGGLVDGGAVTVRAERCSESAVLVHEPIGVHQPATVLGIDHRDGSAACEAARQRQRRVGLAAAQVRAQADQQALDRALGSAEGGAGGSGRGRWFGGRGRCSRETWGYRFGHQLLLPLSQTVPKISVPVRNGSLQHGQDRPVCVG